MIIRRVLRLIGKLWIRSFESKPQAAGQPRSRYFLSYGSVFFRKWARSKNLASRRLSSPLDCGWMQNVPFVRSQDPGPPEAWRIPRMVKISLRDFHDRSALDPVNHFL